MSVGCHYSDFERGPSLFFGAVNVRNSHSLVKNVVYLSTCREDIAHRGICTCRELVCVGGRWTADTLGNSEGGPYLCVASKSEIRICSKC